MVTGKANGSMVTGKANGSCSSKQSRSEKKSGRSMPKRRLIAKRSSKVESTVFDQLMRECQDMIATWKKQKVNPVPEEEWMAVLQGMPDLDENLKLDAVDSLRGDSVDAQIFLALTGELQKEWLIRKLRPNLR
ncbi:hypothetical protein MKW92_034381 [Papaver armeniacum]|nr:hypothetical protein MKW92_034381 [Papaver armeniacum]